MSGMNQLHNRKPVRTVTYSTHSERKNLKVADEAAELLSDIAKSCNRHYTQGVVVYEYLHMFEDFKDDLSEMMTDVDGELERYGVDSELVDAVKWSDRIEIDTDNDETKRRNIWLPHRTIQSAPSINWSQSVADVVVQGINSVYTDRMDRYETKQALLDYVHSMGTKTIQDRKAELIISDSDRLDVPEMLVDQLQLVEGIETISDYAQRCDGLSRWSDRCDALFSLYDHHSIDYGKLIGFVADTHGITKEYTEKKLDELVRSKNILEMEMDDSYDELRSSVDEDIHEDEVVEYYNETDHTLTEVLITQIDENSGMDVSPLVGQLYMYDFVSDGEEVREFLEESEYLENARGTVMRQDDVLDMPKKFSF